MDGRDEYEFKFDAYTPKSIPMERLAKYLAALAKMFGNQADVHFQEVTEGSTKCLMNIEPEAVPKVKNRLDDINRGVAANDANLGFNEINDLLISDNAVGTLVRKTCNEQTSAVILSFPGRDTPRMEKYGPFTETMVIDGELNRIGGADTSAHALIIDPDGVKWKIEMSRNCAQAIAPYLYKGPILRITGDARWERLETGEWKNLTFKMTEFTVLEHDTLEEVTKKLRGMRSTDWCNVDDLDLYITTERGLGDGMH